MVLPAIVSKSISCCSSIRLRWRQRSSELTTVAGSECATSRADEDGCFRTKVLALRYSSLEKGRTPSFTWRKIRGEAIEWSVS
jgi:hypothetical protein